MIEVEAKFLLPEGLKEEFLRGAEFVKRKTNEDIYYDGAAFPLVLNDVWLRNRNGRFELKWGDIARNAASASQSGTHYEEIENDAEIRARLKLPPNGDLAADLARAGYAPFCTCITDRSEYKNTDFVIDLDSARYKEIPGFTYNLVEIELMVAGPEESDRARERILDFAQKHGFTRSPEGKITEFIRRALPDLYEKLVAKGLIFSKPQ